MASLRELRRKIKSVKSTEQITKAMKMVAAARMRRSQAAILSARPFAVKMGELVRELSALEAAQAPEDGLEGSLHPFFSAPKGGPEALILVTGDKGLCGAFNANLFRAAVAWFRQRQGGKIYAAVVGRKGRDFVKRLRGFDCELILELAGIFPKASFAHAELLGRAVVEAYKHRRLSGVTVIYNEFKSVVSQRLVSAPLLPIPPFEPLERAGRLSGMSFEPARAQVLEALLSRYLKAQLYRILLESQAAELAARMNSMDAASKKARELRDALNLSLNRQRQALITKEIAELVGGAEALAA
jgi:F-type H+-transporting ATPase subunit gamma